MAGIGASFSAEAVTPNTAAYVVVNGRYLKI
jgi:hypothetical protein